MGRMFARENLDDANLSCTFPPVVDLTVIRLMLAIAIQKEQKVHKIDNRNAFVRDPLDRKFIWQDQNTLMEPYEQGVSIM